MNAFFTTQKTTRTNYPMQLGILSFSKQSINLRLVITEMQSTNWRINKYLNVYNAFHELKIAQRTHKPNEVVAVVFKPQRLIN